MESIMKLSQILVLTFFVLIAPNTAQAQVAGSALVGVAAAELRDVATGWSAKRQVLGAPVYNDLNERIGDVDDIIIAPDPGSVLPRRSNTVASASADASASCFGSDDP